MNKTKNQVNEFCLDLKSLFFLGKMIQGSLKIGKMPVYVLVLTTGVQIVLALKSAHDMGNGRWQENRRTRLIAACGHVHWRWRVAFELMTSRRHVRDNHRQRWL